MTTSPEWISLIDQVKFNPAGIQRVALNRLEEMTGGSVDIVDPTNPLILLLEASSCNSAAAMQNAEALTRQQYPSLALDEQEVYLHMSDADYIDRFATPARTTFTFLLGKDEVLAKAVSVPNTSFKKLTIPRHTEITVAGTAFTLQYPIDIRVMAHGGFQVVYDTTKPSPLQTLTTNLLDWRLVNINGIELLQIAVPAHQFQITPQNGKISMATGFSATYDYKDQFYYARVFHANDNGTWKEIRTTHTDQVFDPTKATALLRVYQGKLQVSVPQIYLTTGQIRNELRVDIYTTKGPMDMILGNYVANNFVVRWVDLEKDDNGKYVAPMTTFSMMNVYSDAVVTGGRNALSFEELRERVMLNAMGAPDLPVTNVQLTTRLATRGYDTVKDVDNITNRQFKATRSLPRPVQGNTIAGAGCTIQTLAASMTDLARHPTTRDNGERLTLLPKTLYSTNNGVLEVVSQSEINNLLAQPLDVRTRKINESHFLFSPFHYVLDKSESRFDLRPYYLDNPSIETKSFVAENDTTGLAVTTDQFDIVRTETGYQITLITKSSDAWKALQDEQIYCQLSFRPSGEKDRAYQTQQALGRLEGGEMIFVFTLDTDYDLDKSDNLLITSFQMYSDEPRPHPTPLLSDFDVVYIASGIATEALRASTIDLDLGKATLPEDALGISRDRLQVRLGYSLDGLWAGSRSVVSSLDYARYTADVPAVYEETIFKRNAAGSIEITRNPDGTLDYVILHAKGDPVLDDEGHPLFKYRKGDVQRDADGEPVVLNTRGMVRQIDLFLVDGVYWFASDEQSIQYRDNIPQTIVGWVSGDIAEVSQYLLEQTELFFYPRSTLGYVPCTVLEDQRVSIEAAQSFAVTFYLRGVAFRDATLRAALTRMAVEVIDEALQSPTVTTSGLYKRLTERVGQDAVGVDISGLGGTTPYAAISLVDDSARLSIKKIAVARADGTVGVEEDVSVTFLQHTAD